MPRLARRTLCPPRSSGPMRRATDPRRLHRLRQPEHGRPAGIPGAGRRQVVAVCDVNTASYGYRTPEQFLGRKPGQERGQRLLREEDGLGRVQGLRRPTTISATCWPARTSTRWPSSCPTIGTPDDRHGGPGRQGHLLREAALADRQPGPGDGRGRARAQAHPPDRQPVPLRALQPPRLRVGPQRPDRPGQAGRHPGRREQRRRSRARAGSRCRCPRASTTRCGSARPRCARTTRTAASTASASFSITRAAR